ncbi:GntR family transcriptional regulator [Corynebacterium pseudodiphtheriticum]|uniref:GntR family transcriptional regulator n=1 Tax=Corynebacterium pseudodiphtheriticum TaxID=37637 RepID=UPI0020BD4DAE|nr:GntR family transcriptional regulator [Corynebacterium pseudodiphtheriticum]MDK8487000.1 GntR family transcriptional regulator [Corynebacterium pseudodiphtheriticum]MDK8494376.1 GntR family transcriptional regulator [Corynebacterium pseudodiphtheriticum]MDK8500768.1 GntR family transcriptional regulator [Corynebacterium pseudodiphtheriticum]MDK8584446.1 GntR family transcriptional regulator [Corynebacterium pseudodiphtheriticum]MDK8686439.1 GntR family transcriptional regulator [Corynebacte
MAYAQFPQISARATSLRDQVSESIRAGLITGELAPGEIYSAPQLAAQMGVSATPVREAMLYFEREGMVTKMRNTGYKVTELSAEILDGAAEARILLEVPTMAKIARTCTGETAEKVEELRGLAHMLNDAAERGDLVSYLQADLRFHCDFLALAGNPVIVETVSSLRTRSRVTGLRPLAEAGNLVTSSREHEAMIDAALAQDAAAMEAIVRTHIGHVRKEWAD